MHARADGSAFLKGWLIESGLTTSHFIAFSWLEQHRRAKAPQDKRECGSRMHRRLEKGKE
jgi:hypothetical protein